MDFMVDAFCLCCEYSNVPRGASGRAFNWSLLWWGGRKLIGEHNKRFNLMQNKHTREQHKLHTNQPLDTTADCQSLKSRTDQQTGPTQENYTKFLLPHEGKHRYFHFCVIACLLRSITRLISTYRGAKHTADDRRRDETTLKSKKDCGPAQNVEIWLPVNETQQATIFVVCSGTARINPTVCFSFAQKWPVEISFRWIVTFILWVHFRACTYTSICISTWVKNKWTFTTSDSRVLKDSHISP